MMEIKNTLGLSILLLVACGTTAPLKRPDIQEIIANRITGVASTVLRPSSKNGSFSKQKYSNTLNFLWLSTSPAIKPKNGFQKQDFRDCASSSGVPDDEDLDGIPNNVQVTYNCSYESEEGLVNITGSSIITDDNDSDPSSGFFFKRDSITFTIVRSNETFIYNTDIDLNKSTNEYSLSYEDQSIANNTADKISIDGDYSPNGIDLHGGILNVQGEISVSDSRESSAIDISTDNLQLARSCENGVQSGDIHYTTAQQNGIISYQECKY